MTKSNTKRACLSSVLVMILCLSMLIGTTFAWFTDSASTAVNKIQSGNLDIVLEMKDAQGNWVNAEDKMLNFVKADNRYGTEVLWEPGCTYELPAIRVRNEGNLFAQILVMLNGVTGDEKLMEAIEFTTTVTESPLSQYDNAKWPILWKGTELDNGVVVEEGNVLADWSLAPKGKKTPGSGHTDTSPVFTISGHMKEEAGNEYQGLSLDGISIVVVATQRAYEYDSFGNRYDADAEFPGTIDKDGLTDNTDTAAKTVKLETAGQLFAFAESVNVGKNSYAGYTVTLENDMDLVNVPWTPIGQTGATEFKGVFDGQGHTISNLNINNADTSKNCATGLFGWIEDHGEGIVIKNVNIDGAAVSGHHNVGVIVGYIYGTVENCNVSNAKVSCTKANDDANGDKCGVIAGYVGDATIKDCSATDCTVSAGRDAGQIVGCATGATIAKVTGCTAVNVTVEANGTSTGKNVNNAIIGRTN